MHRKPCLAVVMPVEARTRDGAIVVEPVHLAMSGPQVLRRGGLGVVSCGPVNHAVGSKVQGTADVVGTPDLLQLLGTGDNDNGGSVTLCVCSLASWAC